MAAKKYFLDQEFIEGWRKPIWWLPSIGSFNKKYHTIELISLGIVCYDGREYFAVNKDFNERYASDWVKENVIKKLPPRYIGDPSLISDVDPLHGQYSQVFVGDELNKNVYKSLEEIKKDLCGFLHIATNYMKANYTGKAELIATDEMEFYGYYADYDWVLFCSLFGTMMDLPRGMPMYMIDLKQQLDESVSSEKFKERYPLWADISFDEKLTFVKKWPWYPKQTSEHDALYDARFNKNLHEFIIALNK